MTNRASCLAAFLAAAILIAAATGQTTLPICTVGSVTQTPNGCPATGGWSSNIPSSNCYHATVSCTLNSNKNAEDLGITFGYASPSGTPSGMIVFFSYAAGTQPSTVPAPTCPQPPCYTEVNYFNDYLASSQKFQVMQTAWDNTTLGWEDTGVDGNNNPYPRNVGYAAARVIAFLKWVHDPANNIFLGGAMCAQGNSAGGGAIAYMLAWYGGYAYLDHAVFLSSPPLSDIEQGCKVDPHELLVPVTVCPTGQLGCSGTAPWTAWAQYTDALGQVGKGGVTEWTDDPSLGSYGVCRGNQVTAAQANTEWKNMSIVDGNVNTFNYPQTSMTAWLCSSVYVADGDNDDVMNNSSSQAQLYFGNFTSASQYFGLTINGVSGCNGPEDVTNASPNKQLKAIEGEMETACVKHH